MRQAWFGLLVVVLGAWSGGLGQKTPKDTFPRIVAKVSLFNLQSETKGTLFTPTKNGVFRFSVEIIPHQSNSYWDVYAIWTDGIGAQEFDSCTYACTIPAFMNIIIRTKRGKPISYRTQAVGGSPGYDLFIVLEQLE